MTRYEVGKILHEARRTLAWGPSSTREPWPNFDDPKTLRAYSHNPISYVDLALAQADAIMDLLK